MHVDSAVHGPARTLAHDVRKRLRLVLGSLVVLLIAVFASSFFVARGINEGSKQKFVNGAIPLKSAVQDLLLNMVNQETGSRGYVITGDPVSLLSLTTGRAALPRDLRAIEKGVSLVPALRSSLKDIRVQVAALERFFDEQIALVESGPAGQRAAAERIPEERKVFTAFRLTAGKMLADTDRFVASARQSQNRLYNTLVILLLVLGGAALTIAVTLSVYTPRRGYSILLNLEAERQAANELRRREQEAQGEVEILVGRLQGSLLPVLEIDDPDVHVSTVYRPGEQRLQLGGDFYDCLQLKDGRVVFLIGDVSGHGPDAAALGASLRAAWRGLTLSDTDHAEVMRSLQAVFEREGANEFAFATVASGRIDATRTSLQISLAGHPLPILLESGTARVIDAAPGPPLGVFDEADWAITTVRLDPRSAVIFYTDGVTEALNGPGSRERVGTDWLVTELARTCVPPITDHDLEALADRLAARSGEAFADDVAILAVSAVEERRQAARVTT